jgi:hypothetical protein
MLFLLLEARARHTFCILFFIIFFLYSFIHNVNTVFGPFLPPPFFFKVNSDQFFFFNSKSLHAVTALYGMLNVWPVTSSIDTNIDNH